MLGWVKQILAGNHNPDIPKNATVARDGHGRVAEVNVTLGHKAPAEENPSHVASSHFQKELNAASEALVSTNIALIQKGIGLQESYEFSQDSGQLTFLFNDGRKITAQGDIIGSFDPSAKSFMWAWANTSLRSDENSISTKLRALGGEMHEDLLLTPKQSLNFSKITELMAFALKQGEFDGVYRAITNEYVSVFIGYRLTSFIDVKGRVVSADSFMGGGMSAEHISQAQALCGAYDAQMLVVDKDYNAQDDRGNMAPFLSRKNEIYVQYWERDDDYWKPSSFGWPSDHDLKIYPIKFTGPASNQAVLVGRIAGYQKTIYQVEFFGDDPKITDQIIEWGDGFIWPN